MKKKLLFYAISPGNCSCPVIPAADRRGLVKTFVIYYFCDNRRLAAIFVIVNINIL